LFKAADRRIHGEQRETQMREREHVDERERETLMRDEREREKR
jgi:hypothetical protein